jgi:carboxypeptidase Taq
LFEWLSEKVYRPGGRYPPARLIELATGSPPDARPFVASLRRKYEELYGIG